MSDMSRKEYFDEVRSLAAQCVEEAREYGRELSEVVWETIDGHEWVIYTAYNYDVLRHSDNSGAYCDNYGDDGLTTDGQLATDKLAYAALEADVMEHALPLMEEDEDAEAEDVEA